MNVHVLLKFKYKHITDVVTIDAHLEVLKQKGRSWWGTGNTGIAHQRMEDLHSQIALGIPTFVFLYETQVPKQLHPDGIRWYRAKVHNVSLTSPNEQESRPEYYRDLKNSSVYFQISDIQQIKFNKGETPKVPGQTSIRHVGFMGDPIPKNLFSLNNKDKKLCNPNGVDDQNINEDINSSLTDPQSDLDVLKSRVIDLYAELSDLKDENKALTTYKDYYDKIIKADYLFASEKLFEAWIEDNIHKIAPECNIIDRQPHAKWPDGKFGRMDLLAINKESKDLVIIEVKTRKRSKSSGYDQFVRYSTWASNNQDKLKSAYAEHGLKPTQKPEFFIITDHTDDEMQAICKHHGIKLIIMSGGLFFDRAA